MNMKPCKPTVFAQRYVSALRKHLKQGSRASLQPAQGLGHRAVALRLETLDVARIHEGALASREASGGRNGVLKRAEFFFTEAVTPIEKTHRAALKANTYLNQLNKTLGRRTEELAATNRRLRWGSVQRKAMKDAFEKSGKHQKKCLEESRRLQKHLQHLARQVLSAQEDKRKKISHSLQNEIAQTLLGINVRLLMLNKEVALNTNGFKKEIASTQRLVEESVQSINRFARKLRHPSASVKRSIRHETLRR